MSIKYSIIITIHPIFNFALKPMIIIPLYFVSKYENKTLQRDSNAFVNRMWVYTMAEFIEFVR